MSGELDAEEVWFLAYKETLDSLILCHPSRPTYLLTRQAENLADRAVARWFGAKEDSGHGHEHD